MQIINPPSNSGGGGASVSEPVKSAAWYSPLVDLPFIDEFTNTLGTSDGVGNAWRIVIPSPITISPAIFVTTPNAGAKFSVSLYSVGADNLPGALVKVFSEFDMGTAGLKTSDNYAAAAGEYFVFTNASLNAILKVIAFAANASGTGFANGMTGVTASWFTAASGSHNSNTMQGAVAYSATTPPADLNVALSWDTAGPGGTRHPVVFSCS